MSVSSVGSASVSPPPPQPTRGADQDQDHKTPASNGPTQSSPPPGTGQVVNKTA